MIPRWIADLLLDFAFMGDEDADRLWYTLELELTPRKKVAK
jgi:hypothetical protein